MLNIVIYSTLYLSIGKKVITAEKVLAQAISLKPLEQAKLVDNLIAVLDEPNPELDKMWAEEAESRLDAFKNGEIKTVSLTEVLSKYK